MLTDCESAASGNALAVSTSFPFRHFWTFSHYVHCLGREAERKRRELERQLEEERLEREEAKRRLKSKKGTLIVNLYKCFGLHLAPLLGDGHVAVGVLVQLAFHSQSMNKVRAYSKLLKLASAERGAGHTRQVSEIQLIPGLELMLDEELVFGVRNTSLEQLTVNLQVCLANMPVHSLLPVGVHSRRSQLFDCKWLDA